MNAQISFLDGTYKLIHISRDLYPSFLQPILRVLLPQTQSLNFSDPNTAPETGNLDGLTAEHQHSFLNISLTPLECSVVVHSSWSASVFEPLIPRLSRHDQRNANVSKDEYLVLSVISAGMDAGERVMELTSPLAMAGIPIFFITTYYSDFILVPAKARPTVVKAFLDRGFAFSDDSENSFVAAPIYSPRRGSPEIPLPGTPPPSTLAELQQRTFETLKKRNIVPYTVEGLKLMQCSGLEKSQFEQHTGMTRYMNGLGSRNGHHHSGSGSSSSNPAKLRQAEWLDGVDTKLYTALMSALVSSPRFISVTLAQEDPPSLLLDTQLSGLFGNTLVGGAGEACMGGEDSDNSLVPIFLDLSPLPLEVTGIVSGVAGRLMSEMRDDTSDGHGVSSELSYLSTAKAGAVILSGTQSRRALDVLKPWLLKGK
ncbi:hypothetical protein MKZ38_005800 [Zalerion maritima]|uniref:CASTOR ACT domain-containing protein n=1 Tax=Zalerion maritima TaxID=339359 RepID=A0AAD5WUN9_9PEZI|nr:hypothetical protein MKZ38_005800 [Zalerion maritima]